MAEPLPDRWADRDFPALRAIVAALDDADIDAIDETYLPEHSGLSERDALAAVRNLKRGGYIEVAWSFGDGYYISEIGREALEATGVWPNAESTADQLLWILEQKVADAATPEEHSKWQRIRDSFGSAGRDFAVEIAAAMAARSMGA